MNNSIGIAESKFIFESSTSKYKLEALLVQLHVFIKVVMM
jgi:hypothetical protein